MKILIIGRYDYSQSYYDLRLLNRMKDNDVTSPLFVLETLIPQLKEKTLVALTLSLAEQFKQDDMINYSIYYGVAPRTMVFDKIVAYDIDTVSAQEAALKVQFPALTEKFYTSEDAEDIYKDISEVIKNV